MRWAKSTIECQERKRIWRKTEQPKTVPVEKQEDRGRGSTGISHLTKIKNNIQYQVHFYLI